MRKFLNSYIFDILITILLLVAATLLGLLIKVLNFHETNVVVIYLFSVVIISRVTKGYIYGVLSSVVAILLFNWFFTEPYHTFKVNDLTYLITFAIMALTSIVTSTLTTKVKKSALEARERELESNALYQMTNYLTDAENSEAIAKIAITTASSILSCSTAFVCFDEDENPEKTFFQSKENGEIIRRELSDGKELKLRIEKLHGNVDVTNTDYFYPVFGKITLLAVLSIPREVAEKMTEHQKRMVHSIVESTSMALERLRSLTEQAKSREETAQERYRGNLLRAISHDIRTPLSGIMGTSEMLMGGIEKSDSKYLLAKDIYKDAEWLHGLVENILNLTKLQDGKLILKKTPEAVEEVIAAALMVMEKSAPEKSVDVKIPEEVVLAPMDAKLISQVLINLLDNAIKHSEKDCNVKIFVETNENEVFISVVDNGNGISKKDLPNIFKMFYTTSKRSADSKRGVGLGLAICQSIIEAHGGRIWAENCKGGGAKFTFTLPIEGDN